MTDSMVVFPTSKSPRCEAGGREQEAEVNSAIAGCECLVTERLAGYVQRVQDLNPSERDQMYVLLAEYFSGASRRQFERDLKEKEWVILLSDTSSGQLQGFSTLMRMQTIVDGQPIVAFFSGDTIIRREYWGETTLPRLWARHVFSLARASHDARVFWFLISAGYKTYRFLPIFFREFYPTYRHPTPPGIKRLLDALAQLKYPSEYDPERGVVRFANASPLRSDVAEITEQRLRDPHVAFFAAANPGHINGDELVCLTEITPSNLTAAGRRMLGIGRQDGA